MITLPWRENIGDWDIIGWGVEKVDSDASAAINFEANAGDKFGGGIS
jgi:hypothetical protein